MKGTAKAAARRPVGFLREEGSTRSKVMADQNIRNNQQGGGGRRNPADNLSHEDRVRGGERSASMQQRDAQGQFSGRKGSSDSGRGGTPGRSGGGGGGGIGMGGSNTGGGAGRTAGNQ